MKIGIIVFGEFREFEIARKSWSVFESTNCDFYFSTWSKSYQKHEVLNIEIHEEINENHITKYYPNAKIKIHDESNYISNSNYGLWNVNIEKMIFHWKYGLKMIKESEVKYDIIILLRHDLFVLYQLPYETLYNLNKPNTIYGQENIKITSIDTNDGEYNYFVYDTFLMGNYEVMSNLIEKCDFNYGASIHNRLGRQIVELKYYVELIDSFKCIPVRPNSRNLTHEHINYFNIANDHYEFNKNYKI